MLTPRFKNNAVSSLAYEIEASSTIIELAPGEGIRFPELRGNDYFAMTLGTLVFEIVYVTERVSDICTVLRGQESTTALPWPAETLVQNLLTEFTLTTQENIAPYIEITEGVEYQIKIDDVYLLLNKSPNSEFTFFLPSIDDVQDGKELTIKQGSSDIDIGVNVLTVISFDSLINGQPAIDMEARYEILKLKKMANQWWTV